MKCVRVLVSLLAACVLTAGCSANGSIDSTPRANPVQSPAAEQSGSLAEPELGVNQTQGSGDDSGPPEALAAVDPADTQPTTPTAPQGSIGGEAAQGDRDPGEEASDGADEVDVETPGAEALDVSDAVDAEESVVPDISAPSDPEDVAQFSADFSNELLTAGGDPGVVACYSAVLASVGIENLGELVLLGEEQQPEVQAQLDQCASAIMNGGSSEG